MQLCALDDTHKSANAGNFSPCPHNPGAGVRATLCPAHYPMHASLWPLPFSQADTHAPEPTLFLTTLLGLVIQNTAGVVSVFSSAWRRQGQVGGGGWASCKCWLPAKLAACRG